MRYLLLFAVLPSLCGCGATGRLVGEAVMLPVRIFKSSEAPQQQPDNQDEIQTAMAFDGDAP